MNIRLVITDVDNTLFDWQALWFSTFSAMTATILEDSKVPSAVYYAQCKSIFQKYGTSEYAFVLSELPCLQEAFGSNLSEAIKPAIDSYREARSRELTLYPTVLGTLQHLKSAGVCIAAYTESKAFYTSYRFRKLQLDGLIDFLYSPDDHQVPENIMSIRRNAPEYYDLQETVHRTTPDGELKPNPHILRSIIEELGFSLSEALYVGDSLLKDIYMAQQAGVQDVHAAYGASQHRKEQYDLLKLVTHWTPEMVEREKQFLGTDIITPSYVLKNSFSELNSVPGLSCYI